MRCEFTVKFTTNPVVCSYSARLLAPLCRVQADARTAVWRGLQRRTHSIYFTLNFLPRAALGRMLCFCDGSLLPLNDASLLTGCSHKHALMCAWFKCHVPEDPIETPKTKAGWGVNSVEGLRRRNVECGKMQSNLHRNKFSYRHDRIQSQTGARVPDAGGDIDHWGKVHKLAPHVYIHWSGKAVLNGDHPPTPQNPL